MTRSRGAAVRRRTAGGIAAVVVLTVAGCGGQAEPGADRTARSSGGTGTTACDLVPSDLRVGLIAAVDVADAAVTDSGPVEPAAEVSCTLSSRAEQDLFLRLQVRPATSTSEQQEELRSGPLNPACDAPRRYDEQGGVGVTCVEDIGGATTTRLTSAWGEDEVVAQVTRPGDARSTDADSVWALAREGHAAYAEAVGG